MREAFAYLERNACFVQRGPGGTYIDPGAGLMGMAFRHRMSRAGDPALHTHVVVPNTTRALSDDRWLSLASPKGRSAFWQHAKAAGYVYQAALRAEVTRELGAQWGEVRNGYADLAEIERPVIEHFSQRRMEIVAAMAERGVDSAAAAEVAAYRTRDAKDYGVDVDERRAEWIARAAEFELSAESIEELLSRSQPARAERAAARPPGAGRARLARVDAARTSTAATWSARWPARRGRARAPPRSSSEPTGCWRASA